MRSIACFLALSLLALTQQISLAADKLPSRPNIILVMTDDQGYGELGCHGNPIIKTPNLDRLHDESLRFTDFQVSPTCSPTRTSIMTGRHEFRSGVSHTIQERERMSLSATTIAQVLKGAGYSTGIFGKWHLGDEDAYQPDKRGFDEVYIHGCGGIGQSYPGSCGDVPGNSYFSPTINHNGTFEKTDGFCTDVFFAQALKWIDQKRQGKEPFFTYLPTNAPHAPYHCPEKYAQMYQGKGLDKNAIGYYGMITNIDDNMGTLMAKLKEWNLVENTLLIFMTDNGHSIGTLYNAGMKGMKNTPHQGGTRVPAFWRWTGTLKPGDCSELTAAIDIFPTFCDLAGAKVPGNVQLDGYSLVPLLENPQAKWHERMVFAHIGRWKKGGAAEAKFDGCSVRTNRFRFVNNKELYDILADPGQSKNVIDEYPAEVAKLRAAYDKWWAEVLPFTVENEQAVPAAENPYKVRYWKQFGGGPKGK